VEPSQVKASKISEHTHEVIKLLESKGIKHSEMMAIGMGVSKHKEGIMEKRKRRLLKSSVGIIMPTCNPGIVFDRFLPTVEHITELNKTAKFLINFNGPRWDAATMLPVVYGLQNYGFDVRYDYTGNWDKPIQVLKMREQCAEMWPEADLYLFIDDDFKFVGGTNKYPFSSGQRYLHSIDYMTRFPKCGLVNTKSFLGGTPQKLKIKAAKHGMVATGQGLFLRNMSKHGFGLWPEELQEMRGGLEEQSACYVRIERGYYVAQQFNNPTIHITGRLSDWDDKPDNFHNTGVIDDNLAGWIRNRYQGDWDYQHRKVPDRLWRMYLGNGGIELTNSLTIDYAEYEGWDSSGVGRPKK